jgi:pimeloyl-ACP methyl ester carboxylesterase
MIIMTIDSRLLHGAMPLTLATPAGGGAHRPLLVFLHGLHSLGYDNNSQLTEQMFAALHALGPRAPDIAFPYGDDSYWVNGADGAWSSYVLHEVIPKALKVLNADPRRVAIGGISMGGIGAYLMARLHPGRFCAVGGHSAAIDPGTMGTLSIRSSTATRSCGWTSARVIRPSLLAMSSSLAPCTSTCTCGRAATTSDTGTRTGAPTWASTHTRSPLAVSVS